MAEHIAAHARATGKLAADVSVRGHALLVGEPPELGGDDRGPMPTELLAAALASCMTLAVQFVAGKRDREVPGLAVDVEARRAGREPRYGEITVTVSADLDEDELSGLVERARRFCWVSNTLNRPPAIEYAVRAGRTTTTKAEAP
jgi:putative redox protein